MTNWVRSWTALLGLALAGAALPAGPSSARSSAIEMTGAPDGFSQLEAPRDLLVDVYFGKRRIGETWIIAKPGYVTFRDPSALGTLLPELLPSPQVAARLSGALEDHAALACSQTNARSCGTFVSSSLDVIFDADRFRIDLFVAPEFLAGAAVERTYLEAPDAALSLTSSAGGALSGSNAGSTSYTLQNRTIIGFGNARLRSDSSIASGQGLIVDDLVAEVDTNRHRYAAGLFWAPGVDLTGRRRIAGFGFTTQFDTREDSDSLEATPLILFLNQPSRVEVLIDGRLATSASYEAGNRAIDTSSLPSGSYPLVLRIHEPGGNVREERRFFVKNAEISPLGQPVYFAFAGLLANTERKQPISLSKDLYYQVGAARRLSNALALNATVLGTQDKVIAQLGGWLVTDAARVRAAALVSSDGDKGVFVQAGSAGTGPLNFSLDVRRIWSRSGGPLIPLPAYADNFGAGPPTGAQAASGSYSQASGSMTYSVGGAFFGLSGSYRRDSGSKSDYSIGPSVSWPILNRGGLQLVVNADAQRSRSTTAAFAGFRLLYTAGGFSTLATAGHAVLKEKDRHAARPVGSLSAQWFHTAQDRTQISLEGAVQRDVETTSGRVAAQAQTRLGSGRAEVLHTLEGNGGTQYGLSFQTGMAFGGRALELGGRDLNQSAIIASLGGSAQGTDFEILIDDVPHGRLGAGAAQLPIFLEAYRSYRLRLRPLGATAIAYDSSERTVTLFPGTVEQLRWDAEALVTVFGQAIASDGSPIGNAPITAGRGIGQTDENGYFEIDARAGSVLQFRLGAGTCQVPLAGARVDGDYARLGKVECR